MKKIGIYIFRRDLRIDDNLGLYELSKKVDEILPVFILDKFLINKSNHNRYYFSSNVVQFMCESLVDLNKEYSNYSRKRDKFFTKNTSIVDDNYLYSPRGKPYKKFSSFYNSIVDEKVKKPLKKMNYKFIKKSVKYFKEFPIRNLNNFYRENKYLAQRDGRRNAIRNLNKLYLKADDEDDSYRLDHPTSNLSGYLNFGCISVREAYYKVPSIRKKLVWRDFLFNLYKIEGGNEFKFIDERFNKLKWKTNEKEWKKLINASTGYLLIDAVTRFFNIE